MSIFTKSSLLVILFLQLCSVCTGDLEPPFLNPYTFHLNSNFWKIHEDEAVGTRVTEIRLSRESGNINITYTVEPSHLGTDVSDHFRVDTKPGGYGSVYLQKSFKGHVNKEYLVSVVGTVGELSRRTRVEVRVRIEGPVGSPEGQPPLLPPKITEQLFPPPGAITPVPPPNVISNNNFPGQPLEIPSSTPSSSTSNVPSFTTSERESSSINTFSPPQDNFPTVFQPHFPSTKKNNSVDGKPTDGGIHPSTTYNVTDPVLVDERDNNGKKDYQEIPDNEIGNDNSSNMAGIGIPHQSGKQKEGQQNQNGTSGGDGHMALVTTIPIVAILAIVLITAATLYLVNKKNKIKKRPVKEIRKESAVTINSNTTMSGEGEPPTALQQWVGKRAQSNRYESWAPDAIPNQAVDRWEFPRHHLQIGGILGEGCFGQVWRCEALNIDGKEGTTTTAVKTLKESAGERERMDLLSELTVMKMLDPHPNVVRLLGCCTDKDPIFVIMEYVALGKLQTYLRSSRASHYYGNLHGDSTSLSSKDLTSFAYQVARGMEYLASKGIIHRDLAARNILIDKERICKVADFGFARDIVDNHVYERKSDGRLPIRWMAPEALYDNLFTTKTDVWSFGVLMWEIVTLGSTPYPGMAASEVMRKVRDGYRLEKPEHCRRELYNIMFYCWAHNPVDRPSFSDLVNFLSHLLFSETDYIELDRFPDHDYYNMASLSGEKL